MKGVFGGMEPIPTPLTAKETQPSLAVQTYGGIIAVLKQSQTPAFDNQCQAIKTIVDQAFQDAAEGDEFIQMQEQAIQQLTAANEEMTKKITAISAEHSLLKEKFSTLEGQKDALDQSVGHLSAKHKKSGTEYTALQEQTKTLATEYQTLQHQYEEIEARFAALKEENQALASKGAVLDDQTEQMTADVEKLTQENTKLHDESIVLTQKWVKLDQECQQLKGEAEKWSQKYGALNEDFKKLQQAADVALQKIAKDLKGDVTHADLFSGKGIKWHLIAEGILFAIPFFLRIIYDFAKNLLSAMNSMTKAPESHFV